MCGRRAWSAGQQSRMSSGETISGNGANEQQGSLLTLREVHVEPRDPASFADLIGGERMAAVRDASAAASTILRDRVVWNINSTATGGGVAEMLAVLLAYARGAGVDTRWLVIEGNPAFFEVTKRLHNRLHG